MDPRHLGGTAVFCAIICPAANIGLFIRQPDFINPQTGLRDPQWKIASGEVEPGESIPAALLRETEEETGFVIPNELDAQGLIVGNDDARCHFLYSDSGYGRTGTHERQYFVVVVRDPREIIALDGQVRKEDDEETIETRVFDLDAILADPNFLPKQRPLLNRVVDFAKQLMQSA
jgi:8-oxo-dGTP pyrophosphatase MutT (NUDIX family)